MALNIESIWHKRSHSPHSYLPDHVVPDTPNWVTFWRTQCLGHWVTAKGPFVLRGQRLTALIYNQERRGKEGSFLRPRAPTWPVITYPSLRCLMRAVFPLMSKQAMLRTAWLRGMKVIRIKMDSLVSTLTKINTAGRL